MHGVIWSMIFAHLWMSTYTDNHLSASHASLLIAKIQKCGRQNSSEIWASYSADDGWAQPHLEPKYECDKQPFSVNNGRRHRQSVCNGPREPVLVSFDFRRCRMPIAGIICCYLLCEGDRSTLPTDYMALQIQFSSPFVDAVRSAVNFTPSKGSHLAFAHSAIQNHGM